MRIIEFQVAHVTCDWILSFFVRIYSFSPYGLYYCEGWLSYAGFSKPLIMVLVYVLRRNTSTFAGSARVGNYHDHHYVLRTDDAHASVDGGGRE